MKLLEMVKYVSPNLQNNYLYFHTQSTTKTNKSETKHPIHSHDKRTETAKSRQRAVTATRSHPRVFRAVENGRWGWGGLRGWSAVTMTTTLNLRQQVAALSLSGTTTLNPLARSQAVYV